MKKYYRTIGIIIIMFILTVGCKKNDLINNESNTQIEDKYSYVYNTDCQKRFIIGRCIYVFLSTCLICK